MRLKVHLYRFQMLTNRAGRFGDDSRKKPGKPPVFLLRLPRRRATAKVCPNKKKAKTIEIFLQRTLLIKGVGTKSLYYFFSPHQKIHFLYREWFFDVKIKDVRFNTTKRLLMLNRLILLDHFTII
ncbi:hypothetical protein [Planococcus donghaensis]|uniref:Uncharacterized protein n=1 Tax=Planococcus donghaensis TaxID=414778 RepID=A0A1C7EIW6_9BACL|nr:hypothetical protein [Planococcus donghaensis]ANU23758.1 hypothetical protein BCM40_10350 [Planococcus donghaensis]